MKSSEVSLNPSEWRAILALCGVFFLRMLGLFLILPELSPYANSLGGTKPFLIGIAHASFPLTQTLLQVPFGWLSDNFGRKPVIVTGLLLFVIGSVLAAVAETIIVLIIGLAIQGSGAIGSVVVALLADLTRDEVRTRAMAMIGGSVGLALGIGFVAGPLIAAIWNASILFYVIAVLALIAIPTILFVVPTPESNTQKQQRGLSINQLINVINDQSLWRLHFGIFTANASLRALFVVMPFLLEALAVEVSEWLIYLVVLVISGVVMFPTIFIAERKGWIRQSLFGSIGVLTLGLISFLWLSSTFNGVMLGLTLYFIGFSLIEAILPSLVTRLADATDRGTAMGVFNMSQYLGAVVGSVYGGLFLTVSGETTMPHNIPWMFGGLILFFCLWTIVIRGLTIDSPAMAR